MNAFTFILIDATQQLSFTGVSSFIGVDATGSFGIQARHARFMTVLSFGLAQFRIGLEAWQYLAMPGGILYFNENELTLSTRHFLIDTDLSRISEILEQQLTREEDSLRSTRESLHQMDQAMLKCLIESQRKRD